MAQTQTENGKVVLTAQEARQGKELGVMRYVLHISLALAVVAGVVIYAIFSSGRAAIPQGRRAFAEPGGCGILPEFP